MFRRLKQKWTEKKERKKKGRKKLRRGQSTPPKKYFRGTLVGRYRNRRRRKQTEDAEAMQLNATEIRLSQAGKRDKSNIEEKKRWGRRFSALVQ